MTGLNWSKSNARARMRARGTESMSGGRSLPAGQTANPTQPSRATAVAQTQCTLAEIDKFWRDRSGRAIVVRITEYNGHQLLDIRTFFTANDGTMRPDKGVTCPVRLLPQLARSIDKAITEARRLGYLPDTEAQE